MAKKNKNEMSFLDHLEDLRWLLVRSSAVIVIMAIVTYAFSDFIFDDIIFGPTHTDFITYRFFCDLAQAFGVTGDICVKELPFTIQNTSMEGQINVFIWTCVTAGFILAFPYILYELWKFISPALYEKEKKGAIGFIVISSLLF
ncbi:MAG TPA: twin-arginine translocase subunit TatC, partial [Flavobacterium sp.]|nr:twin-arginine translocase subunit TatC [Flavobacterium sp.]